MKGHIHSKCPEGDRDAQKSVGARGRVQIPKGQVRLAEKERPRGYKETAGIARDQGSERQTPWNHVYLKTDAETPMCL